jgi:hypothetical protein
MPDYRLVMGHATVLELFDALDDEEAGERARELAMDFPPCGRLPARRSDFRVERQDAGCWRFVVAWEPADVGHWESLDQSSRAAS